MFSAEVCGRVGGGMKAAIPIFRDKVAPRFENASELLVVTISGGDIAARDIITIKPMNTDQRVAQLARHDVRLLVCCRPADSLKERLRQSGIRVVRVSLFDASPEELVQRLRFWDGLMTATQIICN